MTEPEREIDQLYQQLADLSRQLSLEYDPATLTRLQAEWEEANSRRLQMEAVWLAQENIRRIMG